MAAAKVLIVDDDVSIQDLLANLLRLKGYVPFVAGNGQVALTFLEQETVDVILLDLMMPLMDGMEFCRTVRARGIHTPILLVSAHPTLLHQAKDLDVQGMITKPFRLTEILQRISALVEE